jgi:hypothetical protein
VLPGLRTLVAALALFLIVTAVAEGQSIERVPVTSGGAATAGLPASVVVSLTSPPDYTRNAVNGSSGSWVGPEFWASGKRDANGHAALAWTLAFDKSTRNTEQEARAALKRGWKDDLRGGVSVPHIVLGRNVGTIDGDFVLTAGTGASDASYELAMAFAVAPGLNTTVDFLLTSPATDSAGGNGQYLVSGAVPAALWNRGQALRAMSGVALEGNLPPTRITARVAGGGALVRGTVGDAFRHPVLRERVTLQRSTGNGWRRLTTTRTDFTGAYSVRVGRRAQYRVVAGAGKSLVASAPVEAGR